MANSASANAGLGGNSDGIITDIDGSILEGGGQILRTAVALSAIKQIPIRIFNIRANRSKPGLAEQHMQGILLVQDLCNGQVKGVFNGSTEVYFCPGPIKSGHFKCKIRTAGSMALLMQIAVPVALFAPGPVTLALGGGTDADMAPPIDFITKVTSVLWSRFGALVSTKVNRRGFFPKGGGEVDVEIQNKKDGLIPVTLTEPGEVSSLSGTSVVGGTCPIRVAHEMKKGAESILIGSSWNKIRPNINIEQGPADCAGSSITIVAETTTGCVFGTSAIGNRSKSPRDIGAQAASDLVEAGLGRVCVDPHAQDQIILLMALSKGVSEILCGPITLHTKTAIAITEQLTQARYEIKPIGAFANLIRCTGHSA